MAAVCAQTRRPVELLVIDDGQLPDERLRRLADRAGAAGIAWQYWRKDEPGLTRSRNLALARATGDVVQFFDDDAEPAPDYLQETAEVFAADVCEDLAVLGGTVAEPTLAGWGGRFWRTGARLSGWWRIGRRRMRRGPWPKQLHRRVAADPNLIGAALAVRKAAVWPPGFDESLRGYALGEDREIAYRMARTHLVGRAMRAHAVHHQSPSARPDPAAFGHAVAYNYAYILCKNVPMGLGEWVVVGWGLFVLGLVRMGFAVSGEPGHHLRELLGMVRGSASWIRHCLGQADCCS